MAGTLSWRSALTDRPWHVYSLLLAFFWLVCAYVDHILVTVLACILGGMASEVIADLWPVHKTGKTEDKSHEEHFDTKPLPPEPVEEPVVHQVEERVEKPLEEHVEEHFNEPAEEHVEHHFKESFEEPAEKIVEHFVEEIVNEPVVEQIEKSLHESVQQEAPCFMQVAPEKHQFEDYHHSDVEEEPVQSARAHEFEVEVGKYDHGHERPEELHHEGIHSHHEQDKQFGEKEHATSESDSDEHPEPHHVEKRHAELDHHHEADHFDEPVYQREAHHFDQREELHKPIHQEQEHKADHSAAHFVPEEVVEHVREELHHEREKEPDFHEHHETERAHSPGFELQTQEPDHHQEVVEHHRQEHFEPSRKSPEHEILERKRSSSSSSSSSSSEEAEPNHGVTTAHDEHSDARSDEYEHVDRKQLAHEDITEKENEFAPETHGHGHLQHSSREHSDDFVHLHEEHKPEVYQFKDEHNVDISHSPVHDEGKSDIPALEAASQKKPFESEEKHEEAVVGHGRLADWEIERNENRGCFEVVGTPHHAEDAHRGQFEVHAPGRDDDDNAHRFSPSPTHGHFDSLERHDGGAALHPHADDHHGLGGERQHERDILDAGDIAHQAEAAQLRDHRGDQAQSDLGKSDFDEYSRFAHGQGAAELERHKRSAFDDEHVDEKIEQRQQPDLLDRFGFESDKREEAKHEQFESSRHESAFEERFETRHEEKSHHSFETQSAAAASFETLHSQLHSFETKEDAFHQRESSEEKFSSHREEQVSGGFELYRGSASDFSEEIVKKKKASRSSSSSSSSSSDSSEHPEAHPQGHAAEGKQFEGSSFTVKEDHFQHKESSVERIEAHHEDTTHQMFDSHSASSTIDPPSYDAHMASAMPKATDSALLLDAQKEVKLPRMSLGDDEDDYDPTALEQVEVGHKSLGASHWLSDEVDPWQAAGGAKAASASLEAAAIDDAPSGDDISQRAVFGDDEEQDEEALAEEYGSRLGDSEVEDRNVDDDDDDDLDDDFSRERKNSAREVPKQQDADARLGMDGKQLVPEKNHAGASEATSEEHLAAAKIQAAFKGFKTRAELKEANLE